MTTYFAHSSSIIEAGSTIGAGTKIWHFCHIMPTTQIGESCTLGQNVYVGDAVIIGNRVKIQNNVSLYEGVICEDDVFIGPSAVFTNVVNPRSFINRSTEFQKTNIGKGATIGANATIVCGNDIGAFALIGAGSVVTKPVPKFALIIGNPGLQIGWVSRNGHRLAFDKKGIATCSETGEKYLIEGQYISPL